MIDPLVKRALESYQELQDVIQKLTAEQLHILLDFEIQTRQRKSVIERCIRQLVVLHRIELQTKYLGDRNHGT